MAFYGWKVPTHGDETVANFGIGAGDDGLRINEFGDTIAKRDAEERMHLLGWWHNAFFLVPWFLLVYYVAYLWTAYVDMFCATLTRKLEDYVTEPTEKSSGPLLS